MKYLVLLGRFLFSLIFIMAITFHFTQKAADYAASNGVPAASFLVPAAGVLAFLGGVSILLGFKTKIGAWMIAIFLIPVTFYMHAFWKETDPMKMQMQQSNFMKNISLLGGALIITYFGSGALSLDNKLGEKN